MRGEVRWLFPRNELKRDLASNITTWQFDNMNRLTTESWGGSAKYQWTYDQTGQLTSAADVSGMTARTTLLGYSVLGQPKLVTQEFAGLSFPVTYDQSFNEAGLRTKLQVSLGATADLVNEFGYDNLLRQTSVSQRAAIGEGDGPAVRQR